jgi:hypothetical protein
LYTYRTTPALKGLRADGIILLGDEDCSKDLLIDTYGADPTKTNKYGPHIKPLCATFLTLGFTVFGSFSKEPRSVFDRFTQTIFEREQDSFCRSLASIRKYYLNLWSTMWMSMSAACVTKARIVSSR